MAIRNLEDFQGLDKTDYKPRQVKRSEFRTDVLDRIAALEAAVFGNVGVITLNSTSLRATFPAPDLFSSSENVSLNVGDFSAIFNVPIVANPGVSDIYTNTYKDLY